jgi:hypothetical protein
VQRLVFEDVHVDATPRAFTVMAAFMAVDACRSRARVPGVGSVLVRLEPKEAGRAAEASPGAGAGLDQQP